MLAVGRELVTTGTRHVEVSDDDGETFREIADCMPVLVEALDRSSLKHADKLIWALDAVLEDQYELCEAFALYLHRRHPGVVWSAVAEQLLSRLKALKPSKGLDELPAGTIDGTISVAGPFMPWNRPAERTRSFPCVKPRPNARAVTIAWWTG